MPFRWPPRHNFNVVAANIPKDIQISEVDAKLAPVNVWPWTFVFWEIVRGGTTFSKAIFAKNEKYEHGGQLNFKINIVLGRQLMNRCT
jgi:hypothetical protein